MTDWFETTDGLFGRMWQTLAMGVADPNAPARHPTFATVGPAGWPEARTVVLRAVDARARSFDIHTDLKSAKVASLRATKHAALHVWDVSARLQIRLSATVTILTGPEVAAIWARVPDPSRQSYGVTPPPATPIPDALSYVKQPDPATFAVLNCAITAVDLVHLGAHHRRARFGPDTGWQGQWLAP